MTSRASSRLDQSSRSQRYRALTGASRRGLQRQIEQGFPFLPSGSQVVLDRVAQRLVLDDVASAAVTGLAGSTGVVLPLALIIGAFTLTRIYKVVNGVMSILDLIARLRAAIDLFEGTAGDFGKVDAISPLRDERAMERMVFDLMAAATTRATPQTAISSRMA